MNQLKVTVEFDRLHVKIIELADEAGLQPIQIARSIADDIARNVYNSVRESILKPYLSESVD